MKKWSLSGLLIFIKKYLNLTLPINKCVCNKNILVITNTINLLIFKKMFGSKETDSTTNEEKKAILDFDGKKYDINTLPDDVKEILKGLQIADTQFKMQQDNLKLIDIGRKTLGSQLNQKLKNLPTIE